MFRAAKPDATLILLHIPKTAGTTLSIILMNKYGEGATHAVTGGSAGREAFSQEPEAARRAPRLFIGHQAFGLHEHIPRHCEYVTVVREPVARIVSHYHHVLNEPKHYLHRYATNRRLSLEQYAENPLKADELDNGQTRMLADYALSQSVPAGSPERRLLDSAKSNLERFFCCVGLTERFDETMVMLTDTLGWERVPQYLRRGRASRRLRRWWTRSVRSTPWMWSFMTGWPGVWTSESGALETCSSSGLWRFARTMPALPRCSAFGRGSEVRFRGSGSGTTLV